MRSIKEMDKRLDEREQEIEQLQQAKDNLQKDYQEAVDKITNLQQENKQLKEKLDKVNKKINQYEIITGYYDSNYDGVEDTYSHDIKNELLKLLGDKENE